MVEVVHFKGNLEIDLGGAFQVNDKVILLVDAPFLSRRQTARTVCHRASHPVLTLFHIVSVRPLRQPP